MLTFDPSPLLLVWVSEEQLHGVERAADEQGPGGLPGLLAVVHAALPPLQAVSTPSALQPNVQIAHSPALKQP